MHAGEARRADRECPGKKRRVSRLTEEVELTSSSSSFELLVPSGVLPSARYPYLPFLPPHHSEYAGHFVSHSSSSTLSDFAGS